ncbi:molybdopterin-dependent oxidoreductase [Adlercreutzia sp. R25]|uniref:molybdopterin-dependent oxidoreductase n=1 Tax=Adlercreutzia shanghongiae TaxID=3111773 RepID=UPI002DB6906D|nr:molybdopterin-dependent oxidoreductase [Adlercreutzia sp. R25]MEC4271876.1 molybdopterin-dependent oxidoreductase [Adlercreutzia sp. R25]
MKNTGKKVVSLVAASSMVMGAVGATQALAAETETLVSAAPVSAESDYIQSTRVSAEAVEGSFTFTQGVTAANEVMSDVFRKASAYLCGSSFAPLAQAGSAMGDGTVAVKGAVDQQLSVNLEERAEKDGVTKVMGCSCSGDGIGGSSHGNAEVTGVLLRTLLDEAGVQPGVNTIVFEASDGYEVALPLTYVIQRYSMLVTQVGGEPVADVMGGANQLWLGSTAANSYVRDVRSITLESREVAPQAPGMTSWNDEGSATPHISVSEGASI